MFGLHDVAVLIITLFLSNGMATSRVINAPSLEDCQAAAPAIVEQIDGKTIAMGDEKLKVEYVDAQCIVAHKGTHA